MLKPGTTFKCFNSIQIRDQFSSSAIKIIKPWPTCTRARLCIANPAVSNQWPHRRIHGRLASASGFGLRVTVTRRRGLMRGGRACLGGLGAASQAACLTSKAPRIWVRLLVAVMGTRVLPGVVLCVLPEVVLKAAFAGTCVIRVSFGLAMINSSSIKLFVVSGLLVFAAPAARAFLSCDWVIVQEVA